MKQSYSNRSLDELNFQSMDRNSSREKIKTMQDHILLESRPKHKITGITLDPVRIN